MMTLEKSEQYLESDSSRINRVEPRKFLFVPSLFWKFFSIMRRDNTMKYQTYNVRDMTIQKHNQTYIIKKDRSSRQRPVLDVRASLLKEEHSLTPEKLEELVTLAKDTPHRYVEELVRLNVKDHLLLTEQEGNSYLLPSSIRKDCQKCKLYEGENYRVCFVDNAIDDFSSLCEELTQKRRQDSYTLAEKQLENQKIRNLQIYIHPFTEAYSVNEGLVLDEEPILPVPKALYYSVIQNLDRTLPDAELALVNQLIDFFVQAYGYFEWGKFNREEIVLYNGGSLKIEGTQYAPLVLEKAKSYMKK